MFHDTSVPRLSCPVSSSRTSRVFLALENYKDGQPGGLRRWCRSWGSLGDMASSAIQSVAQALRTEGGGVLGGPAS